MKPNSFSHLLGIDFETWIVLDNLSGKNLTNKERIMLDQGYTLKTLNYTLKILKKFKQRVTFFVVFKLEELFPGLIERILKDGHEVGWHTYSHPAVSDKKVLIRELEKSKKNLIKYKIKGFQAPQIIFFREGYPILKKYGLKYSSSIYGNSEQTYLFDGILEIPVSTTKQNLQQINSIRFPSNMTLSNIIKTGLPIGSSFFWGLLGKHYYSKKLFDSTKSKKLVNLFVHNWQITPYKSPQKVNIFKNPAYLPYIIDVSDVFEHLIKNHKFQTFKVFLNSR